MNITIRPMKDCTVIEASGKVDRGAVISAGRMVRVLDILYPATVVFDIDRLEDEREMFYHVALITAVKKEVEQSGGTFILRATRASVRSYMRITGLEILYTFDEPVVCIGKEEAGLELQVR